uniref:Uncharacterized protein n=1 Tax=Physcomitrium patens TaxID=3218 RepID=A0A2K1JLD0_PHYPA|nr:hypothetical protein PHYPA_017005 [Physcomitrium patens]
MAILKPGTSMGACDRGLKPQRRSVFPKPETTHSQLAFEQKANFTWTLWHLGGTAAWTMGRFIPASMLQGGVGTSQQRHGIMVFLTCPFS